MQEELPLVSIVTPVFNMASFVEETIQSVLSQDYPRIEYIVMDGGSTDGTLDILSKYRDQALIVSARDDGAADAVNRGFTRSSGSIFAYLNADDVYTPNAVSTAVRSLLDNPDAGGVYGEANWIQENGGVIGMYPTRPFDPALLAKECFICQPASFVRRAVFEQTGLLDARLRYTFDYDFWIRLAKSSSMAGIAGVLACSRMHGSNKTLGHRREVFQETIHMLKGHFGYAPFSWVYAYACYLLDGRDQFFEPIEPSVAKLLLGLAMGLFYNAQHPLRYSKEWGAAISMAGLRRHLRRAGK